MTGRRVLGIGVLSLLLAAEFALLGSLGYAEMFSSMQTYDDEGCMLIGIKQFVDGLPLYDEVFSMYGPFSFLVKWLIYAVLGVPVSHDTGRLICLAYWLAAAALSALVVWRVVRAPSAAMVAAFAVFKILTTTIHEPGHPQELCAPLLLASIVLAPAAVTPRRGTAIAASLAAIGGILVMTKVNVGIFFLMALGGAMLAAGPHRRWNTALAVPYVTCLLIAPELLMKGHLHEAWNRDLALNVSLSIGSTLALAFAARIGPVFRFRDYAVAAASLVFSVAAIAVVTHLCGTSWHGVIDGSFLIGPRNGTLFTVPRYQIAGTVHIPFRVAVLVGLYLVLRWAALTGSPAVKLFLALGRIAFGIAVLTPPLPIPRVPFFEFIVYGPALACALMLPVIEGRTSPGLAFTRLLLALLAITQTLWAYPVAGSQLFFSTFLCAVVEVIFVYDGFVSLGETLGRRLPAPWLGYAGRAICIVAVALVLVELAGEERRAQRSYRAQMPLGLPGAVRIHRDAEQVRVLQRLVAALRKNPDTFITLPGLNSLYLWAEKDPPTGQNLTNWMLVFDEARQDRIVRAVADRPAICAVVAPDVVGFWAPTLSIDRLARNAPLVRYIRDHFRFRESFGPFLLLDGTTPKPPK